MVVILIVAVAAIVAIIVLIIGIVCILSLLRYVNQYHRIFFTYNYPPLSNVLFPIFDNLLNTS